MKMRITGTFLDEISHDIPHQNWGYEEWDECFKAMQDAGIDKAIMIRCGYKRWMTFPSEVLIKHGGYRPPVDLIAMFLELAQKYAIKFFCGTYDSGNPWWHDDYDVPTETALMQDVNDEIIQRYGQHPAFGGWYLSQEIARRTPAAQQSYRRLGERLKEKTNNLPILISPGIMGPKAYDENMQKLKKGITPEKHEEEWNHIMAEIHDFVDIIAFQDGHLEFEQLPEFLAINKKLCDRYGIQCWTNTESFDRDMPIDFLPIKWEKLLLKLRAAQNAGLTDAITFEFPHFMSPNSCYLQAHGLYKRYKEYLAAED